MQESKSLLFTWWKASLWAATSFVYASVTPPSEEFNLTFSSPGSFVSYQPGANSSQLWVPDQQTDGSNQGSAYYLSSTGSQSFQNLTFSNNNSPLLYVQGSLDASSLWLFDAQSSGAGERTFYYLSPTGYQKSFPDLSFTTPNSFSVYTLPATFDDSSLWCFDQKTNGSGQVAAYYISSTGDKYAAPILQFANNNEYIGYLQPPNQLTPVIWLIDEITNATNNASAYYLFATGYQPFFNLTFSHDSSYLSYRQGSADWTDLWVFENITSGSNEDIAFYLSHSGSTSNFHLSFSNASANVYDRQGASDFSSLWIVDSKTNASKEGTANYLSSSGALQSFQYTFSSDSSFMLTRQGSSDFGSLWLYDLKTNSLAKASAYYQTAGPISIQQSFQDFAFSNGSSYTVAYQGSLNFTSLWLLDIQTNISGIGSGYYLSSDGTFKSFPGLPFAISGTSASIAQGSIDYTSFWLLDSQTDATTGHGWVHWLSSTGVQHPFDLQFSSDNSYIASTLSADYSILGVNEINTNSAGKASAYYLFPDGSQQSFQDLSFSNNDSPLYSVASSPPDSPFWLFDLQINASQLASAYYLSPTGSNHFPNLTFSSQNTYLAFQQASIDASSLWLADRQISGSQATAYYLPSTGPKQSFPNLSFSNGSGSVDFQVGASDFSAIWLLDSQTNASKQGSVHYLSSTHSQHSFSDLLFSDANASINRQQGLIDSSGLWVADQQTNAFQEASAHFLSSTGTTQSFPSLLFSSANTYLALQPGSAEFSSYWFFDQQTNGSGEASVYYLTSAGPSFSFLNLPFSITNTYLSVLQNFPDFSTFWLFDPHSNNAGEASAYYLSSKGEKRSFPNLMFSNANASLTSLSGASDSSALWLFDNQSNASNQATVYYLSGLSSGKGPSVAGWRPGMEGLALNTVFNSVISGFKALFSQREGMQRSSEFHQNMAKVPLFERQHLDIAVKSDREPSQNVSHPSEHHHTRLTSSVTSKDRKDLVQTPFLAMGKTKETPTQTYPLKSSQDSLLPYSFRFTPFNDYVVQDAQGSISGCTNEIIGALATFDAKIKEHGTLGCGVAYSYNYAKIAQQLGSLYENQELILAYGSWQNQTVFLDATCWGGFYQLHGIRKTLNQPTGRFHTHGYLLSPHVELRAKPFARVPLEALAMVDWVNQWQNQYREHSAFGLHLHVPHTYASLLRSEVGLRIYQTFTMSWGEVKLSEKGSYIYQTPFQKAFISTLLGGGADTIFSVGSGTLSTQNLGSVEFRCSFLPNRPKVPFCIVDMRGDFGSKLQAYFVALELGEHF